MKNWYSSFSLLMALFVLSFCQNAEKKQKKTTETVAATGNIFEQINQEVQANANAYAALGEASKTIGHRLTGSANGAKAEEFALSLFKKYGYENAQFHEFEAIAWSRESVSVSAGEKGKLQNLKAVSLALTPVSSQVEGEVINVNSGLKADFEAKKQAVKGKIVLLYLGLLPEVEKGVKNLHRSEKTALAIEYGAKGVIFYNSVKNGVLLTGTASVTGKLIGIPAVCISNEDGEMLKNTLKTKPVLAKIDMKNKSEQIKARNVVATLEGETDETIVIGGHLDSWDLAQGAIDNGIGSFAVMDIARTFKALKIKPKRTIQFIMFMGEEQGLLGSEAYVKKLQTDGTLAKYKYVVNIDMAGNPIGFGNGGRDEATDFLKKIGEKIKAIDTIFRNEVKGGVSLHSDHKSFMMYGIPFIGLQSNLEKSIYDCYHADCDDFSLVNETHLKNTVRFSSMMLYDLANADSLPAKTMNDEELKAFLVKNNLRQEMEISGEWRWK